MPQNEFYEKVLQYEPQMVFGRGENFYPASVENYVAKCSLHTWIGGPNHVMRVPPGDLRLQDLWRWNNLKNFMVYADDQFWDEPLVATLRELQAEAGGNYHDIPLDQLIKKAADTGYPGNEEQSLWKRIRKLNSVLDFVGIASRGDLPHKIFDQAKANYGDLSVNPPTYYYRVFDKRENPSRYDVIQYWFFYPYNDWASAHRGVNDHEADWESVFVYFDDIRVGRPPIGMIYSAHSTKLWRPWRTVKREDGHPIVHVAPGSHASYPPSDFATILKAMTWRPLSATQQLFYRIIEAWRRGGEVVGGTSGHPWAARHDLMAPENDPWVEQYKGRWGARYLVDMPLKARQQIKPGGSPGGPKWEKNGKVRQKWADPAGWARL